MFVWCLKIDAGGWCVTSPPGTRWVDRMDSWFLANMGSREWFAFLDYVKFELTSLEQRRLHRSANTMPMKIMETPPTMDFEKTPIPPTVKAIAPTAVPRMFMIQGNFEEP